MYVYVHSNCNTLSIAAMVRDAAMLQVMHFIKVELESSPKKGNHMNIQDKCGS